MKNLVLLVAVAFTFTGCATTGLLSGPGLGFVYTATKDAEMATTATAAGKTGKACANNYLGIVAMGDASIEAAKKAGGITAVSSVDREYSNILGIIGEACTIVKGN